MEPWPDARCPLAHTAPLIRSMLTVVPALGLVVALSAAAPEPSTGRSDAASLRSCIDQTSASWTPYDDHTILVREGARAFQVTTNRCPRLADPLPRITVILAGGSLICSPRDVRLQVSDSADSIPTPCFPQSITPLTQEQARALETRKR